MLLLLLGQKQGPATKLLKLLLLLLVNPSEEVSVCRHGAQSL
jgi:hypothetical protein